MKQIEPVLTRAIQSRILEDGILQQTRRQRILKWVEDDSLLIYSSPNFFKNEMLVPFE